MTVDEGSRAEQRTSFWTIGHSTRAASEFTDMLLAHQIETLVDVRSFPGSRRYPHFNKTQLSELLSAAGIDYLHLPELGGRRQPRADSKNTAWKNAAFRGYGDHMETDQFKQGIEVLTRLGRERRLAVMCAEALWWRCHRSLIADYLKASGFEVLHIMDAEKATSHPFTAAATIVDGRLSYEGLLK
jgi:uncharacterized protein (DUF488 family)